MIARSFRLVAARLLPGAIRAKRSAVVALAAIAAASIFAGCGGSSAPKVQRVAGSGFHFSAPGGWTVTRSRLTVGAAHGSQLVQVSTFPLTKPYRPALYARVATELQVRMRELAQQTGGTVSEAGSATPAGVRSHVFRVQVDGHVDEYTFVLVGRREYQLLCRAATAGAPPCRQLQSSFGLA